MTRHIKYASAVAFAVLALGAIVPTGASAACSATTVTAVLDYGSAQCSSYGGFITAGSGGFWVCALNDKQYQLALTALLTGRTFSYQLGAGDNDCNPGSNYSTSKAPTYVYLD